jgi:hypothetical protein
VSVEDSFFKPVVPTVTIKRKWVRADCQIEPSLVAFESTNIVRSYMFEFTNVQIISTKYS